MTLSTPTKPEEWQTAYTINQAYRESGRIAPEIELLRLITFVIIFASGSIFIASKFSNGIFGIILSLGIALAILFLLFFLPKKTFNFAVEFFSKFYLPPKNVSAEEIIDYRLHGRLKFPLFLSDLFSSVSQFKYIIVKDGEIEKKDEWPAWQACNVGGPILLIIFDGCALYLERGNCFSRVVGPGDKSPFLEWYETIKYAVDLRPKIKEDSFEVWTKDGIRVKLTVKIECRIGDIQKHDPEKSGLVYPYDPEAVKKAVERYALRWPDGQEEPSEFTWVDAVWGQVTGIMPGYIGGRMLDDLLIAERRNGQILSSASIQEISASINKITNAFGVFLMNLQITKLAIPPKIEEQQRRSWEVERQSLDTISDGQTEAFSIRIREKARAEAQRDLIAAIADGLEQHPSEQFVEPLLLSLSRVLDESLKNPLIRTYMANESLDTLERIKNILDKPE